MWIRKNHGRRQAAKFDRALNFGPAHSFGALGACAFLTLGCGLANAQSSDDWQLPGGGVGNWNLGSNWALGLPTTLTQASISTGGDAQIDIGPFSTDQTFSIYLEGTSSSDDVPLTVEG